MLTALVSMAPGPNALFIMSQAALRGPVAGIKAGLGIELANVGYFALTAFGLATMLATSIMAFEVLKWVGAAYLAAIGLYTFVRSFRRHPSPDQEQAPTVRSSHGAFLDGLVIGLGNPKTVIYFVALLPQFISAERSLFTQVFALSIVGTIIDLTMQWLYANLGGVLSRVMNRPGIRRWFLRKCSSIWSQLSYTPMYLLFR